MKQTLILCLSIALVGMSAVGVATGQPDGPGITAQQDKKVHPIRTATLSCMAQENYAATGTLRCLNEEYAAWDAELNRQYTHLKATLDDAGQQALTAAQRQWLQQREAEFALIEARYAGAAFEATFLRPLVQQEKNNLVRDRVKALVHYQVPLQSPPASHAFAMVMGTLPDRYGVIPDCPQELTWLPEGGIRGLYCRLKELLSFAQFTRLVGRPIFRKGPHTSTDVVFNSSTAFGYYNPDFVVWIRDDIVRPVLQNKTFIQKTQDQYDIHLKGMARSYYQAYQFIHSGQRWVANATQVEFHKMPPEYVDVATVKQQYLRAMGYGSLSGAYLQEIFRGPTERIEAQEKDTLGELAWYNVNTAMGWWLRRSTDRTAPEFFALLQSFLHAYDPEFLAD